MKRSLLIGGVCMWALALGGCGSDSKTSDAESKSETESTTETTAADLSGDDAAYAEELAAGLASGENEGVPEDQATCWANRLVADFGVDRLEEMGLTPEVMGSDEGPESLELSASEESDFVDGFTECIDLADVMAASAEAEGETVTPEMQACFENAIGDDSEAAFAQVFIDGQDAAENDPEIQAAIAPLMGCMFMGMDSNLVTTTTS
jgi:hypothetical protein